MTVRCSFSRGGSPPPHITHFVGLKMDCVYYHFKTHDISETWNTAEIEAYLHQTGLFPGDALTAQNPFLDISLLNVKSYDSWNGNDYDAQKTNYIPIVTSTASERHPQVQAVLHGLAAFLQTDLQEDW